MPVPVEFADFSSLQKYLHDLDFFHWDLTLGRIRRALAYLKPYSGAPRPCIAHILGTNGKGSTATFLASIARAQGLRVGLYTSPHFVNLRERILIDGKPLPESEWVACANMVLRTGEKDMTYFEFITALGLSAFARAGVELLVLEAGLGGRNDAVTAFPADLVIFTPLSLDHENVLGHGLAAIAADKADALAPGREIKAALSTEQEPAAYEALAAAARKLDCPLFKPEEIIAYPGGARLGLAGAHQKGNAHLALAAWQWLADNFGFKNTEEGRLAGLREAFIPGRLQFIPADPAGGSPALILDGAHNTHGLLALRAALDELKLKPGAIIFSALADKDISAAAKILAGLTAGPIFVPPIKDNSRAATPADLAGFLGPKACPVSDLAEALRLAKEKSPGPVLICGSLYLLGEFYTLYPRYLGLS